MMSRHESETVQRSVLEYHADQVGIDTGRLLAHATDDGIITDVEEVERHGFATLRFELADGLEEFRVYAERLVGRLADD